MTNPITMAPGMDGPGSLERSRPAGRGFVARNESPYSMAPAGQPVFMARKVNATWSELELAGGKLKRLACNSRLIRYSHRSSGSAYLSSCVVHQTAAVDSLKSLMKSTIVAVLKAEQPHSLRQDELPFETALARPATRRLNRTGPYSHRRTSSGSTAAPGPRPRMAFSVDNP